MELLLRDNVWSLVENSLELTSVNSNVDNDWYVIKTYNSRRHSKFLAECLFQELYPDEIIELSHEHPSYVYSKHLWASKFRKSLLRLLALL